MNWPDVIGRSALGLDRAPASTRETRISRAGREQAAKQSGTLQQILDHRPLPSSSPSLLRELAAIHR